MTERQAMDERGFENGFLRYIVPFYIEPEGGGTVPFRAACERFAALRDEAGEPLWTPVTRYNVEPDLYDHIARWLQSRDGRSEICRSWHYAPFTRRRNDGMRIDWLREDGTVEQLLINRLGVTLFVTGVGFVWYEVQQWIGQTCAPLRGRQFSELLRFSHDFKELARRNRRLLEPGLPMVRLTKAELAALERPEGGVQVKPLSGGRTLWLDGEKLAARMAEARPLSDAQKQMIPRRNYVLVPEDETGHCRLAALMPILGRWLRDVLRQAVPEVRFFAVDYAQDDPVDPRVPDKALLFAFAATNIAEREKLRHTVCLLAKGYHNAYGISALTVDSTLDLFNCCGLYIGREGCAFAAGANAEVFHRSDRFKERFSTIYFWTYIMLLQQTYSLLNFSRRAAEALPADPGAYLTDEGGDYTDRMDHLLLEINAFLVRNRFSSVSSIHHINEFYRYGCRQLTIREDIDSLYEGLRALTEMQKNRRQRQDELREREADEKIETAMRRLAVLAIVSALCDSVGLVVAARQELAGLGDGPSVWFILSLLLWVALWVLVIRVGWPALKRIVEKKEE